MFCFDLFGGLAGKEVDCMCYEMCGASCLEKFAVAPG